MLFQHGGEIKVLREGLCAKGNAKQLRKRLKAGNILIFRKELGICYNVHEGYRTFTNAEDALDIRLPGNGI